MFFRGGFPRPLYHHQPPLSEETTTPRLPKKAVLDLRCNKLFIEGEEFPWYITEDGVDVAGLMGNNTIPALSFTIFAETVDVIPADDAETTTK